MAGGTAKDKGTDTSAPALWEVNIHSCLAVTPDGLVLGVFDQTGYNREEPGNETLTREWQKNRPAGEKESSRRLGKH
jgi:hypothetical protein